MLRRPHAGCRRLQVYANTLGTYAVTRWYVIRCVLYILLLSHAIAFVRDVVVIRLLDVRRGAFTVLEIRDKLTINDRNESGRVSLFIRRVPTVYLILSIGPSEPVLYVVSATLSAENLRTGATRRRDESKIS